MIDTCVKEMKNEHRFLRDLVKSLPERCSSINDYLYMSNILVSIQEKLYFKLKQINKDQYNWLSYSIITQCLNRLDEYIDTSNKESMKIRTSFYPL